MALVDTETGEIVTPDLTRSEARDLTDTIKSNVDSLWSLLKESYDRKAWAALGYGSWREYATTEFGMSKSRAYQLLDQARVITEIEAASGSTDVEITEAAARDLKPVLAEAKAAVEEASKGATSDKDKQERVRAALDNLRTGLVEQQRPRPEPEPSKVADDLAGFVADGSDVQIAQLRKRFADALVRSGSAFTFDPESVAPHLDEQGWLIVRHTADQSARWFERLLAAQPKSLRVMKGGRS